MINFHPNPKQLNDFIEGKSEPGMALVIAAHVDMCKQCQLHAMALQEDVAESALKNPSQLGGAYKTMLADIVRLPVAQPNLGLAPMTSIELDGRKFPLPRALQRYARKTGNWSHLVGKLWQAQVDMGENTAKAHFIYMEKGGKVPEHTHRGTELTLVIDGSYGDGVSEYDTGDFTLLDGSHKHTPYAEVDGGCLVFTIVDKPLHFTSGLARLLNPFSHLFF
jgi:putative transcriptional regulator